MEKDEKKLESGGKGVTQNKNFNKNKEQKKHFH